MSAKQSRNLSLIFSGSNMLARFLLLPVLRRYHYPGGERSRAEVENLELPDGEDEQEGHAGLSFLVVGSRMDHNSRRLVHYEQILIFEKMSRLRSSACLRVPVSPRQSFSLALRLPSSAIRHLSSS